MQMVIDDTTSMYGQMDISAPSSNEIRLRFYIDPNSLTMYNPSPCPLELNLDDSLAR